MACPACDLAAVNAVRRSRQWRTIYRRQRAQSRRAKQALMVVAVKLLHPVYAMLKHRRATPHACSSRRPNFGLPSTTVSADLHARRGDAEDRRPHTHVPKRMNRVGGSQERGQTIHLGDLAADQAPQPPYQEGHRLLHAMGMRARLVSGGDGLHPLRDGAQPRCWSMHIVR